MRKIIARLPPKLQSSWRDHADRILNADKREVCIEDIASFVEEKSRALSNPIFGKLPFLAKDKRKSQTRGTKSKPEGSGPGPRELSNFSTSSQKSPMDQNKSQEKKSEDLSKRSCLFCRQIHNLVDCPAFAKIPVRERYDFVMKQRLCFSCLRGGHQSRGCYKKKPCSHCNGRHASPMHSDSSEDKHEQPTSENASQQPARAREKEDQNRSQQGVNQKSLLSDESSGVERVCNLTTTVGPATALPIVPVKVRAQGSPFCIETYALLDTGSNSTFCSNMLLDRLGVKGKHLKLKLTTMGTAEEVDSVVASGLVVSDLDENVVVPLREVYSRPTMPVSKDEVPKQEDVDRWPHLRGFVYLTELNSQVDLLIGSDVPEALQPKEVIPAVGGGPYASKVEFGWVINGPTGRKPRYVPSACYLTKSIDVHPMCVACADFADACLNDGTGMSREDMKFMNIVEDSVMQCEDGHYQVRLPFRNPSLTLPANRCQAERRALSLRRKFLKDARFQEDYVASLESVIQEGFAEKVPSEDLCRADGKVWYIPHHGVYHSKKPEKIRVVFDCSAQFQGMSLNSELLQGPDLTNNLVGILLRFRQDPVAVMGDVQSMFHQVRVPVEDRDFLRFLWWPGGNLAKGLEEYRMTVHLFGAVSSPSCVNFAMRRNGEDHQHEFSPEVVSTILKNFYVDDCLKSLPSSHESIKHVCDLRNLMNNGGFNLTKWVSNDRLVLESVPVEDRAKGTKELDLTCDALPGGRALGVSWFVEADQFGFKVVIKDRPCTRRGILSAVNSLYDPLGMAAPFILSAKLLVQDLRPKDASNLSSPRISLHVRSIISVTPLRRPMAPYRIFA